MNIFIGSLIILFGLFTLFIPKSLGIIGIRKQPSQHHLWVRLRFKALNLLGLLLTIYGLCCALSEDFFFRYFLM